MKNLLLILSLILTVTACSEKRESDITPDFNPGSGAQSLQALPSNQTTNLNTPFSSTVPAVITNSTPAPVFSIVTPPQHGTVTINPTTGVYNYVPQNNYSGPDSFVWKVVQGPKSATSQVNISVLPANAPPVANNSSISTNEDTPVSGTATGSDPNNDPLTYILVSNPLHGTIVFNSNGTFTYTPAPHYFGPDSFSFKVNDGVFDSNISTISLTVNPVNDAPVASNSNFTTPEDTPYSGNVVASDVDNVNLTYAIVTQPVHGTVTLNAATGTFTYTPTLNYFGPDSFTFRANDGTINSNVATVSINVTPLNDAPTALPISFSTPEDVPYSGLLTGIDPDGNPITYIIVSQPTKGTVALNNINLGTFTYTPNLNQNGSDSFTYKVNDGQLDSPVATVSINITPVNDAPIAQNSSFNVNSGASYNGQALATDIDSTTLTYAVVSNPAKGSLIFNSNGSYTYTANINATGTDTFTFKANDGQLDSNVATISVTFNAQNQAPTANPLTLSLPEDSSVNSTVTGTDPENSPLSFILVVGPTNGSLVLNSNGTFTYTPNQNYFGPDSFTFKANDGQLDSNIATVTLNVTPVNDAPVANNNAFTINEDQTLNSLLLGTDVDGNMLTYAIVAQPLHGTVSLNSSTGSFTYTPTLNYFGSDSFTFKVNDGTVDSNVATISITVNPLNDAPTLANQTLTTLEDTPVSSNFILTDSDGPAVGPWTIVTPPTKGTVNITNPATGAYTYTPNLNQNGPDSFQVKGSDTLVDSNVATITINITPVNDAPIASNGTFSVNPGQTYSGNLIASDVDGDALIYSIVSQGTKGTVSVNATTGTFSYAANSNATGTDSFTFRVFDGQLNSNVATVTVNFNLVNIPPVAIGQSYMTPEDTALTNQLMGTDMNGDPLTYLAVTQPVNGTLVLNANGSFTYTPNLNFNGADSFTFKVNDGQADSNIATAFINVTPVNDAPIALSQTLPVTQTVPYVGQAVATDVDSLVLTYSLVSNTTKGTLIFNPNGSFTYTANINATGTDSFTFKANDGMLDSNVATITFQINGMNHPPVATNLTLTTQEDTAINSNLSATDPNGNALTYSIVSQPSNGTVLLNTLTGAFTYTPGLNFNGPVSFTYKANDGLTDSNIATVSITVTPVNDMPIANGQNITTQEDVAYVSNLTGSDLEGSPLTYAVVTQPQHGTLAVNSLTGSFIYTPNLNFNGSDSFAFKVNDGLLDSTPATVLINVTPVNDAPIANPSSFTTLQNTPYTGAVTGSDVDGNPLTFILVSAPSKGSLVMNPNGSFTYTPNLNQNGPDSFMFKVNDGTVDSTAAPVTINITAVNSLPIAHNQNVTTNEDTPVIITLTATDADGNLLTYSIVTQPQHGTLTGTGATRVYTPSANYTGLDSFTFKANDGTGDSNVATISLTVNPVNDAPVAQSLNYTTNEDTPVSSSLVATDIDSPSLTYAIVTQPLFGTVSVNASTGAFVYTPASNYFGADSFTYKANDGQLDSNIAQVNISVIAVNDAPVAQNQNLSLLEDTPITITLVGTDAELSVLTYTVVAQPQHGTLNGTGAVRIYTPNANYTGPDSFTFKVNDGQLDSNVATISLTVTPINDAPIANNKSFTINEDTTYVGNLTASDVENSPLTYSVVTSPTKGTVTITNATTGAFQYVPNLNQTGPDTFTFKVNDGQLDSNIAVVSITITAVNDAPVALSDSISTNEDTAVNIVLVGTDAELSPLTYTVLSQPSVGTLSGVAPFLVYTPPANYFGVVNFTFKVNDGQLDSNVATVIITVNSVNDAPVAQNKSISTPRNQAVNNSVTATDVEGNPLTYSIVSNPSNGTVSLNSATGNFTYTPNTNFTGSDSFTFRANDGQLNSNVATVSITVTNPNTAPTALSQNYQVTEDTPYGGNMQANDPQGDQLTYTVLTQPTHGTLTYNANNGTFTYTPSLNYNGTDSFTFKANDGQLDSNVATIGFTINPINDMPVAYGQAITVNQNSSNNPITLVGTDVETTNLNYLIVANPQNGTLSGSGSNRTYTPNPNYFGNDSFTFKVNDGQMDSNVATVSITVTNLNGWCNPTFAYANKLLLNNQDQNSALNNFPVMIKLNSSRVTYSDIKAAGADLRFYDAQCNLLAHEIERWDTSGTSTVWVKVPTIAANSNASFIWMMYGNASATDNQNKNAVWSANHVGTWHLEETTGQALDSTSSNNHLTAFGTPVRNVGGRVAGAEQFNSTDDGFIAGESASLNLTSSLTMESWVYLTDYTSRGHIFEKHLSSGAKIDYALFVDSGYPMIIVGEKEFKDDEKLNKNEWYHIAGTYDQSSSTCKIYVNGVEKYTTSSCTKSPVGQTGSANVLKVGNDSPGSNVLKGSVDELRISNVTRPINWIRAQHLSMTDGMVSYGSRRQLGDNWNHSLMTIKTGNDDGKIYVAGNGLYQNGHSGIIYQGSAEGRPVWGYYRFQLPSNIPSNAVIKKASLRVYGRDDQGSWTAQYLVVTAQNSANAGTVTAANQAPGQSSGVPTVATGVSWGAPGLTNAWKIDDWNDTPNLKPLIDNLRTNHSGLSANNYVQLWVTKGGPFGTVAAPILSVDTYGNLNYLLGLSADITVPTSPLINVGLSANLLNSLGLGNLQVCLLNLVGINCKTTTVEKGTEDSYYETINHGQLMIEWQ